MTSMLSKMVLLRLGKWKSRTKQDQVNRGGPVRQCPSRLEITECSAHSVSKVGNRNRGRPEGSLFNSCYSEVLERALLLSLDCSALPLICTLILLRVKQGCIKYHFLKSLVCLDLGLNLGLPDHWRTLFPLDQLFRHAYFFLFFNDNLQKIIYLMFFISFNRLAITRKVYRTSPHTNCFTDSTLTTVFLFEGLLFLKSFSPLCLLKTLACTIKNYQWNSHIFAEIFQ